MQGPTSAKTPGVASAEGLQETKQNLDCASERPTRKEIVTLQAEFALKGHQMAMNADGSFRVSRWNLARHCPDWAALIAFAQQVGVRE